MRLFERVLMIALSGMAICSVGPSYANIQSDYQEASSLYGSGQYSEALNKAQAVTTQDPDHWQAWQIIGNCQTGLGNKQGAIVAYRRSLEINPGNTDLKKYYDQLVASEPPEVRESDEGNSRNMVVASLSPKKKYALESWLGVTTLDFADVKNDWVAGAEGVIKGFTDGFGGIASYKIEVPVQGTSLGVAMGCRLEEPYGIGIRLGVISSPDITVNVTGTGVLPEDTISLADSLSLQAVPLLIGGWTESGKETGLQYRGSIFVGPMWTTVTDTLNFKMTQYVDTDSDTVPDTIVTTTADAKIPYTGTAFAMELGGSVGWGFSDSLTLSLGLAYRIAKVGEVKATGDADLTVADLDKVSKGDAYTDKNNKALPFDFGGVDIRLEARYSF